MKTEYYLLVLLIAIDSLFSIGTSNSFSCISINCFFY